MPWNTTHGIETAMGGIAEGLNHISKRESRNAHNVK